MSQFRGVVDKKKKKGNRRPIYPIVKRWFPSPLIAKPKVIKRDIRRLFPTMFCNVFNSGSPALMSNYLNTYCLPSTLFNQTELSACSVEDRYSQLGGLQDLSTYWGFNMTTAPDLICSIENIKIRVRPDQTSSISWSFILVGTKLIPMSMINLFHVDDTESSSTVVETNHSNSSQSLRQHYSSNSNNVNKFVEISDHQSVTDNERSENEYNNNCENFDLELFDFFNEIDEENAIDNNKNTNNNNNNKINHNNDSFDVDVFDNIDNDPFCLNEPINNQTKTKSSIIAANNNGVTKNKLMYEYSSEDNITTVASFSSEDDSSSIHTKKINLNSNPNTTSDPYQLMVDDFINENESNLSNGLQTMLNQSQRISVDRLNKFVKTNHDFLQNDKMKTLNQFQNMKSSLFKIKMQFPGEMTLHVDEEFRIHTID
eukprot:gene17538-24325_t